MQKVAPVMTELDEAAIREKVKIYRKESSRPLSEYQKAINVAVGDICVQNPVMMSASKGDLLEAARQKVISSGFKFKKGKSRCV